MNPKIIRLQSVTNPQVKALLKLRREQTSPSINYFVLEGEHACEIAQRKNKLRELWIEERDYSASNWKFSPSIKVYLVSPSIMRKISTLVHPSSIIGVCEKPQVESPITPRLLIIDNLQDPGNLGTLMRSAAAFNFTTIIASLESVSFYNPKVLQATQGLIFELNLRNQNLSLLLPDLKQQNYCVIGTFLHADSSLQQGHITQPYALLIGNEGQGLNPKWLPFINYNWNIKLANQVESLNAAVAGSIIMYELNANS